MELHPCACGESRGPREHRLVSGDDGLVAIYEGPCPRCGTARTFEFALDPEIVRADKFGGARPSTIIDPGQFLAAADASAKVNPPERAHLERAVAAMEEVIKFVPPGGDRVPEDAFFTDEGRAAYAREPGRFRKVRLEAVLGVYRDILVKLMEAR